MELEDENLSEGEFNFDYSQEQELKNALPSLKNLDSPASPVKRRNTLSKLAIGEKQKSEAVSVGKG